jgi:hypothetical protein
MKIMPFSKYSIGIAISLILVVLLSQSKILNFFLNTSLGKSILILLLIFIAFIHKILGVVVVLFIIIYFSSSDLAYTESFVGGGKGSLDSALNYIEGFTDNNESSTPDNSMPPKKDLKSTDKPDKKPPVENKDKPEPRVDTHPAEDPMNENDVHPPKKPPAIAKEGFDIIGTENNIKRGKQSNSIPVNDEMRLSTDVLPHEGNSFSTFSSMV